MIPIKSPRQADKMRQACRTASEILDRVSDLVRPGVTTKEVDEAAAVFMEEAGVKSAFLGYRLGHRMFPGNICISINDEVVHGIASQRRIQYGDIVKLDIGVIEGGWMGDTATTVPVGIVDDRIDASHGAHVDRDGLARLREDRLAVAKHTSEPRLNARGGVRNVLEVERAAGCLAQAAAAADAIEAAADAVAVFRDRWSKQLRLEVLVDSE